MKRTPCRPAAPLPTRVVLVLLPLIFLSGFSPFCAPVALAGVTHRWSFQEEGGSTLHDRVGGVDGVIVALAGGGGHSLHGGRLRLGGGDLATADYAALPGGLLRGLGDFTLEVWATPHSFPAGGRVFSLVGPGAELSLSFSRGTNGDGQRLALAPFGAVDSELPTEPHAERHYALVWDRDGGQGGTSGRLAWYRDGLAVAALEVDAALLEALQDAVLWLGRPQDPADKVADASWDEVRLHDEALSSVAIRRSAAVGPEPEGGRGLLHRWSFEETGGVALHDSVGGADGRIVLQSGPGGHALGGGAIRLDGGDRETADYVSFPRGLLDGLREATIELWATPRSFQSWGRVFSFNSGVSETGALYLAFSRGVDGTLQRLEFEPRSPIDSFLPTEAEEEHHYVVTWDDDGGAEGGSQLQWYRDGKLVAGDDKSRSVVGDVADGVLWLGRSEAAGDSTANASWRELRLYARALTPSEITADLEIGPEALVEQAPVARDDAVTLHAGGAARIEVLANDAGSLLDPGSVTVVEPPLKGAAEVDGKGRILYRHTGGAPDTDRFAYSVADAHGRVSAPAQVLVAVSQELRIPGATLRLPLAEPPSAFRTVDAFPGLRFVEPVAIATPPGDSGRLFVVERTRGVVVIPDVTAAQPRSEPFLDLSARVYFERDEDGVMGLAFHPEFALNGLFYVFYTVEVGGERRDRLSRFRVSGADPNRADPASEEPLFSVLDEAFNHNGGDLHFGPDGYLYVSMGDEGTQRDSLKNSQRIDKDLYSGILRIDVDRRPGSLEPNPHIAIDRDARGAARYAIPPDNPWVGARRFNGLAVDPAQVRTELYAVGLRHPWRMSFDPVTGELWVGDVGQDTWEEVDIVVRGGNYGWAYREGRADGVRQPPRGSTFTAGGAVEPLWAYHHTAPGYSPSDVGNSVTGGLVYRGDRLPSLKGKYVFADYVSGNLWSLAREEGVAGGQESVHVERIGGDASICAFGLDPSSGDLLLVDFVDGKISRLVTGTTGEGFPAKLSDTGVFADLRTLEPNPGLLSYEPRVSFWSDHALKSRWVSLPDPAATFGLEADGPWQLPVGATWIKHFELPLDRQRPASAVRVETRILRVVEGGILGASYRWNEEESDATLVGEAGESIVLDVVDAGVHKKQTWRVPSRAECKSCHTATGGLALGFNTRQLNHEGRLGGFGGNLLGLLGDGGYLAAPLTGLERLPSHPALDDERAPLQERVRAYLAVNCAQCHAPGGSGPGTWDARAGASLAGTRLLAGRPANDGGDPLAFLVAPGDPGHSMLLWRLEGVGGLARMPPLGTTELDEGAIDLVRRWIDSFADVPCPGPPELLWASEGSCAPGGGPTTLAWSAGPGAEGYAIFLGREGEPLALQALGVGDTRYDVPASLAPGVYRWRVQSLEGVCDFPDLARASAEASFAICKREVPFARGDANGDASVNLTDAFAILLHLFSGAPASCEDAGDIDDDGALRLTDAVVLLEFLFRGGPPPRAPFPTCGVDATDPGPGCEAFGGCRG